MISMGLICEPGVDGQDEVGLIDPYKADDLVPEPGRRHGLSIPVAQPDELRDSENTRSLLLLLSTNNCQLLPAHRLVGRPTTTVSHSHIHHADTSRGQFSHQPTGAELRIIRVRLNRENRPTLLKRGLRPTENQRPSLQNFTIHAKHQHLAAQQR